MGGIGCGLWLLRPGPEEHVATVAAIGRDVGQLGGDRFVPVLLVCWVSLVDTHDAGSSQQLTRIVLSSTDNATPVLV